MTQTAPAPEAAATPKRRINFGFDKYSGLYVWGLLVVIFSLWIPDLFLDLDNFKTILSFQAISTIVALGLIADQLVNRHEGVAESREWGLHSQACMDHLEVTDDEIELWVDELHPQFTAVTLG